MEEENLVEIGRVAHFYTRIGVAVIELTASISVGDKILIKGANTNFEQTVESVQIEHKEVEHAETEQSIGLKLKDRAREGDVVYKIHRQQTPASTSTFESHVLLEAPF